MLVLEDRVLIEEVIKQIKNQRVNVEFAFYQSIKKYEQILSHYYPQTELARLYDGKYTKKSLKQQLGELDFRVGDACYEFFNCYAVAQCPIWLKNIRLEAQKQDDTFVFVPVETPDIDLKKLKITCEFLEFHKDSAYPKKGVIS